MSTILDRQKSILQVRRAQTKNAAPNAAALADLLAPELRDGEPKGAQDAQVLPFEPLRRFLGLIEPRRQTG